MKRPNNGESQRPMFSEAAFATESDDPDLRRILRESPMPGMISLTLEREPNASWGAHVEGENHQTIIVRDARSGSVLGMGSVCEYTGWYNGEPRTIGYLSQLRVHPASQGNLAIVARGYRMLRSLIENGNAQVYVTTIAADNHMAQKFLEKPKRGFPVYRQCGAFHSLVLPLGRTPKKAMRLWEGTVRQASAADMPKIAEFLRQELREFSFSPVYTTDILLSPERSRFLNPSDFLLAESECGNNILGCMALWNQTGFKQTVVRGYAPWLAPIRKIVNAFSAVAGWVRLPPPGQPFRFAFVSHAAAKDVNIFMRLVSESCAAAQKSGFDYVTLGLGDTHPFLKPVRAMFRHLDYQSLIYLVSAQERAAAHHSQPTSPPINPHLEISRI